ncbi:MAG: hypothetical protein ACK528_12355, partial [Alphaproteobacteria bacterium]
PVSTIKSVFSTSLNGIGSLLQRLRITAYLPILTSLEQVNLLWPKASDRDLMKSVFNCLTATYLHLIPFLSLPSFSYLCPLKSPPDT